MSAVVEFRTPYRDLLPPLSTAEMSALGADIEANGLRDPILIDEAGNVLDGHHRLQFAVDPPVRVIAGLSDAEKQAFVIRTNFTRRNLSLAQKDERAKVQKKIARALVAEGKTQQEVAVALGVDQATISRWINGNMQAHKVDTLDSKQVSRQPTAKTKVSPAHQDILFERSESGETLDQIGADYGVPRRRLRPDLAAAFEPEAAA